MEKIFFSASVLVEDFRTLQRGGGGIFPSTFFFAVERR